MSPVVHLLGSWLIASATTANQRDRKLVTLAGIVPDADGLGVVVDVAVGAVTGQEITFEYFQRYHHELLHGWPAAVSVAAVLACFARSRARVAWLCLFTFHLHLLCDLLGSRGPAPEDFWLISYGEPLFRHPIWIWKGQWRLDGWQNGTIFVVVFTLALWLAVKRGYSFVEILSARIDAVFVAVLRKWHARLVARRG